MVAENNITKPREKRQLVGVRKEDLDRLRGRRRIYDPERGPENKG